MIGMTHNYGNSRHFRRIYNTVKHSNGIISIDYKKSKNNIIDSLTKGLSGEHVNCSSRGMGLKLII